MSLANVNLAFDFFFISDRIIDEFFFRKSVSTIGQPEFFHVASYSIQKIFEVTNRNREEKKNLGNFSETRLHNAQAGAKKEDK